MVLAAQLWIVAGVVKNLREADEVRWSSEAEGGSGLDVQIVDVDDMPMLVEPVPQLVTYDLKGNAIAIDKGQTNVELALQRISRKDF